MIEKGEEILWKGKPKQGFQLVFEDLIIIPFFGVIFFFFVYFTTGPGLILAFIAMMVFIYYRYIHDILKRKSIDYFITEKKVIILRSGSEVSIHYDQIDKISFTEHPFSYKYGSIIFGEEETIFGKSEDNTPFEWKSLQTRAGINLKRDKATIAFIKDYKEVYHLIQSKINELNHVNTK